MEAFYITLNSQNNNVLCSGNKVIGKVGLKISKTIKAQKIELKIIGRAKTGFWLEHGLMNRVHRNYFTSITYYLNIEQNLWESPDDSNKLQAGSYEYPFSFMIPKDAPANFIGRYGTIKYYIKATINILWGWDKHVYCGFNVCPYIDLNLDQKLTMSVASGIINLFSPPNVVKIIISLQKIGYVCGESINMHVKIINESSLSDVTSIETGIRAIHTFVGAYQSILYPMEITKSKKSIRQFNVTKNPLSSRMNKNTVFKRQIEIPPLPPSLNQCPTISIEYQAFVKIYTSAIFSSTDSAVMPIIIGTVPLKQNRVNAFSMSGNGIGDFLPPPLSNSPPNNYTFGDASFGESENQETTELENDDGPECQPLYPYFPNLSHK